MSTTIRKQPNKRGISSTFYDPCKNWDVESFHEKVKKFKLELWEENPLIGFAHCIPDRNYSHVDTKTGYFLLGSPLSFHLQCTDSLFNPVTNLTTCSGLPNMVPLRELLLEFLRSDDNLLPKISFSDTEMNFLKTLVVSESESNRHRKKYNRAEFKREKNFKTLLDSFTHAEEKKYPKNVQSALEHGRKYEPGKRTIYWNDEVET